MPRAKARGRPKNPPLSKQARSAINRTIRQMVAAGDASPASLRKPQRRLPEGETRRRLSVYATEDAIEALTEAAAEENYSISRMIFHLLAEHRLMVDVRRRMRSLFPEGW